jgi:triacylglycerol esterase/lipase EstA (alpha/beta hydrolase family)
MSLMNLHNTPRAAAAGRRRGGCGMTGWLIFTLTTLLAMAGCAGPGARVPQQSDYAREARWAREFEPAVVVGDTLRLKQANGHHFAAISAARSGPSRWVILVHGIGVHPDHGLTQKLRIALHDKGFATLAIQAPILDPSIVTDGSAYAGLMDEAAERIELAILHARSQGATQVFLVGHTMGAWMVNEYFARRPVPAAGGISAWASLGMTGKYSAFGQHKPAVLDVYPERGSSWTRTMAPLRLSTAQLLDARAEQRYVADTDLSFAGKENMIVQWVADFFSKL